MIWSFGQYWHLISWSSGHLVIFSILSSVHHGQYGHPVIWPFGKNDHLVNQYGNLVNILILDYLVIWSSGHMVNMAIWSSGHLVIWLSGRGQYGHLVNFVIWSSNHLVIWSSLHLVIWSLLHLVILWSNHLVIWSTGYLVDIIIWSSGQYFIWSSGIICAHSESFFGDLIEQSGYLVLADFDKHWIWDVQACLIYLWYSGQ